MFVRGLWALSTKESRAHGNHLVGCSEFKVTSQAKGDWFPCLCGDGFPKQGSTGSMALRRRVQFVRS